MQKYVYESQIREEKEEEDKTSGDKESPESMLNS